MDAAAATVKCLNFSVSLHGAPNGPSAYVGNTYRSSRVPLTAAALHTSTISLEWSNEIWRGALRFSLSSVFRDIVCPADHHQQPSGRRLYDLHPP